MPAQQSVVLPAALAVVAEPDVRPNRAARRGKRAATVPARSSAPVHARGAQGRRINPVRRTG